MDLGAYEQIDSLDFILEDNDIEIPRLRGLRLMQFEEPVSEEDFNEIYKQNEFDAVEDAIASKFNCDALFREYSDETDEALKHFVDFGKDEDGNISRFKPLKIHWDRFTRHEKACVNTLLDKENKMAKEQYEMWNKYCGRDDVLYIHARLGSGNWSDWNCDEVVKSKPWFLEYCEDYYDNTYVDIYAKIDKDKLEKRLKEEKSDEQA